MRILYVTLNVLGDPGANAAELFPRLAALHPATTCVITADRATRRRLVEDRQFAQFLPLSAATGPRGVLRNAWRIARAARRNDIDIIHVFYRLRNVALVAALRLALMLTGARARLLVDHRSVNLARGGRALRKKAANLALQAAAHHLAGNPHAVATNHALRLRPESIIDLGHDGMPAPPDAAAAWPAGGHVWFVGSLRPANRKTGFLIEVLARLAALPPPPGGLTIHVAGPARPEQIAALRANPRLRYHGQLPRAELHGRMHGHRGIGIAFMNMEYHGWAPSLKLAEYAMLGFRILASDTPGMRTQAARMQIPVAAFVPETVQDWATALHRAACDATAPAPWVVAEDWSYARIFERQVMPLYRQLARPQRQPAAGPCGTVPYGATAQAAGAHAVGPHPAGVRAAGPHVAHPHPAGVARLRDAG